MGFLPNAYLRRQWADSYSTFTNLIYFFYGFLLLHLYELWMLSIVFVLVGIGSTGYHWLRTKAWHRFDIIAIIYCFAVIAGWLVLAHAGVMIGLAFAIVVHGLYDHLNPRIFIGAFGLIALIAHGMQNPFQQTLYVFMVFACAFLLSTVAEEFYSRDHTKYDMLHGTWHLVSGYGMFLLCTPPTSDVIHFATSQIFYT